MRAASTVEPRTCRQPVASSATRPPAQWTFTIAATLGTSPASAGSHPSSLGIYVNVGGAAHTLHLIIDIFGYIE